ncbi:kinesin protein KIN-12E [Trifolium repens]|nr:kinesin protein KIN-12E [Trifolium repens]
MALKWRIRNPFRWTNHLKSAVKDNLFQSSAFRNITDLDDEVVVRQSSAGVSSIQSFELCEDPSFWKDHNVQVIIRMRPLSNNELSVQGNNKCVRQENCQTITYLDWISRGTI